MPPSPRFGHAARQHLRRRRAIHHHRCLHRDRGIAVVPGAHDARGAHHPRNPRGLRRPAPPAAPVSGPARWRPTPRAWRRRTRRWWWRAFARAARRTGHGGSGGVCRRLHPERGCAHRHAGTARRRTSCCGCMWRPGALGEAPRIPIKEDTGWSCPGEGLCAADDERGGAGSGCGDNPCRAWRFLVRLQHGAPRRDRPRPLASHSGGGRCGRRTAGGPRLLLRPSPQEASARIAEGMAGRTVEKFNAAGGSQLVTWCPSCT